MSLNQICNANDRVSEEEHKHRCRRCGTCWKHSDDVPGMTKEQFEEAHACPSCGEEETMKIMDDGELMKALMMIFGEPPRRRRD